MGSSRKGGELMEYPLYELELNFEESWTRFYIESLHYEMLRPQLENWEALIFIRIREKGATVWSELTKEELANS
jgi:hypothetical protein